MCHHGLKKALVLRMLKKQTTSLRMEFYVEFLDITNK